MTNENDEPHTPDADVKLADAVLERPEDDEASKSERSRWHAGGGSALEPLADYVAKSETPVIDATDLADNG